MSTTASANSENYEPSEEEIADYEDEIQRNLRSARINVMTPELVAALDRTDTTSRNASYIFAAFLKSLGLDPQDYNISKTAIHDNRITMREEMVKEAMENVNFPDDVVIHFDGKKLDDDEEKVKVERLAIVASGLDVEQLLEAPKMRFGTGIATANAVLDATEKWKITDRVKGLCFDTTSVNTGNKINMVVM